MSEEKKAIEDTELALRRLELEYDLAQAGLKGTLIAALAIILMVTIIVVVSSLTKTKILSGTEIATIVALLMIGGVAYGAFVYKRLVTIFGKLHAGESVERGKQA